MNHLPVNNFIALLMIALFALSCEQKDSDTKEDLNQSNFLGNTSTLISSSYAEFNQAADALNASIDSLTEQPVQQNLDRAQEKLKEAWLLWQTVSMYDFGPAENAALKSEINVFKTDTLQIENNISSGNYNLDQIAMKDAKGFPALDYLLNSDLDVNIWTSLKVNSNRGSYLKAVSLDIKNKVNQVNASWASYQNDFINAEGTDVGSSTGMLVNALNQHFEKFFRDNKIGIPLGVRSSGIARPDFVEAAYGNYSIELCKANLNAMKTLYKGNGAYGLDDYLIAVDAADLDSRIQDQIEMISLKLNALSDPLAEQIASNPTMVQEAYNEMQKLIVLWKVDMPSRMGILITYQDNDGD